MAKLIGQKINFKEKRNLKYKKTKKLLFKDSIFTESRIRHV